MGSRRFRIAPVTRTSRWGSLHRPIHSWSRSTHRCDLRLPNRHNSKISYIALRLRPNTRASLWRATAIRWGLPSKVKFRVSNSTRGIEPARIAEHLGGSRGVAISAQVKVLNRAETQNRVLARRLKRLEFKLQGERRKIESVGPKTTGQSSLNLRFDGPSALAL